MALKKVYNMPDGTACEYHTPIIMQNSNKETRIAISSFKDENAYLTGKSPMRSRVDVVQLDSKYPTAEEIYIKIKESRLDKDGNETNFYVDCEDLT